MKVTYNYVPAKTLVKAHLVVNAVLAFIAYSVVGLRIYSRLRAHVKIGWDDIFILVALPQATAMLIIQGLWTYLGVGYPLSDPAVLVNLPLILRLLVAYELVFALTTMTIKLSALCFYLRVFVNRSLQRTAKLTMLFVLLWSAGNILQVFLICRPFRGTYDPTVKAKCGSQVASFIAIGAFNAVTDLLILMLPISTVWTLKARMAVKLALTGVFLIGLAVTGVSIARIVALTSLDLKTNLTGTMIYANVLSTTEPVLGIICISLPMLRPMFWCRCFERLRSSKDSKYNYNNRYASNGGIETIGGGRGGGSHARGRGGGGRYGYGSRSRGQHYQLDDESVALETVYAHGHEHGTDVKVLSGGSGSGSDVGVGGGGGGGGGRGVGGGGGRPSQDGGSETELTGPDPNRASSGGGKKDRRIKVEHQWVVTRT